jgi:cyclic pyranopterin phosphate synthase
VQDAFGHRISYLRISVTDRCNERCRYCMPQEEQAWFGSAEILSYDEMLRVLRVGVSLGISKVRITGGEPLTRPGIAQFCAQVAGMPGIEHVGLSTNGTWLGRPGQGGGTLADDLKRAGLASINISLDSLDRAAYQKVTGRDLLAEALAGIDAAFAAGFESVRLNCVLMKGHSESQIGPLIEFARVKGALLRFIELMPVSVTEVLGEDQFLSAGEAMRLAQAAAGELRPCPQFRTNGPAVYHELANGQRLGFIGAMTNLHFCESCNKLRLTSDGKLRPCLGSWLEFDLREALRGGADDAQLAQLILSVVERKPKEHDFRNNYQPNRRMIAIGG